MTLKNNHGPLLGGAGGCFLRTDRRCATHGLLFVAIAFMTVLIPGQEDPDREFPAEELPSHQAVWIFGVQPGRDGDYQRQTLELWKWQLPDGRGMARAMEYMYPYMLDKKKWPLPPAM